MIYDKNWYNALQKSPLTPPNWIFSYVWSFLYLCMFLVFFNIYNTGLCKQTCISNFAIQLIFNLCWTYVFFKLKKIRVSLLMILIIFIFSYKSYTTFNRIDSKISKLLIPYLIWLVYAFYLNSYIVLYN